MTTTLGVVSSNVDVSALSEAVFNLNNTLDSGFDKSEGSYFIEFVPSVRDTHYVMKYGQYTVTVQDDTGNVVESCKSIVEENNETHSETLSPCRFNLENSVNPKVKIAGLLGNKLYYVNLNYQTYRNNVGFTEEQKVQVVPFTDFIYTPIASDITLGTVTSLLVNNKSVALYPATSDGGWRSGRRCRYCSPGR